VETPASALQAGEETVLDLVAEVPYALRVVLRGFRYRFYPTPEQEPLLRRTIGCARWVYNHSLGECNNSYAATKKSPTYNKQSAHLTAWKKLPEFAWLNTVSCVPLQQALRHMHGARQRFFKKQARFPRFKKKGDGGSAEFTRSAFTWRDGKLTLAKMDTPLGIRWSRPLPENVDPSTVTVGLDAAGRWHVSLLCEDKVERLKPLPIESAVGLDLGITSLVTFSTGEKVANPRHDDRELGRKRFLSRSLARKKKGSKNRDKARIKLGKLNARVADRRLDNLHKLTTNLVRETQVIAVEGLNVSGMIKNRSLARAISDVGWGELVRQLEYKCEWYGRTLIKVDRWFPSSKTCSCCGYLLDDLPLSVREWQCPECGAEHDRDVNAARNVLAAGLRQLAAGLAVTACGPGVRHRVLRNPVRSGLKQEDLGREPGNPLPQPPG